MLTRFQQSGTYHVLYTEPELQAYVKDRFEGFVRQPAETGPVLYSNTSPSYALLKPASASGGGDDDGGGSGAIIAIVARGRDRAGRRRCCHDEAPPHR